MYVGMEKRIMTAQRLRLANQTKRYNDWNEINVSVLSDDRHLVI